MRVVVTGAASGIGRATCVRLARDAKRPAGRARWRRWTSGLGPAGGTRRRAARARRRRAASPGRHGDAGRTGAGVAEAVQRFGGLDGLVSNAGINRPGPLAEYAVEDWDRLFAVNTRATWLLAKAAHPALRDLGGAIVAWAPCRHPRHAGLGAYGPSTAAVIMLVRVLAQEFDRRHPRQRVPAGNDAHRDDRPRYADPASPPSDALVPLGRWPCPTTWRRPSRSCSRPMPATSTATAWSSTAASPATSWPPAGALRRHARMTAPQETEPCPTTPPVWIPRSPRWAARAEIRDAWLEADRLGFDTAWGHDHLLNQNDNSRSEDEGWTILTALLVESRRIRGGLMVTANTFRHPSSSRRSRPRWT